MLGGAGMKPTDTQAVRRRRLWLSRGALLFAATLAALEAAGALVLSIQPGILGGWAASRARREQVVRTTVERVLSNDPRSLAEFDPNLGWRPRPGGGGAPASITPQGIRSQRMYGPSPAAGVLRVAAFGDSFVYGSEVSESQAWSSVIEDISTDVEVLNYGVPGYGQDQIALRFFEEARTLNPTVVLMGVASPTLERIMTVSAVFRSPGASRIDFICKPRFTLDEHGGLRLWSMPYRSLDDLRSLAEHPDSIAAIGPHDYWFDPFIQDGWLFEHSRLCRLVYAGWARAYRRYLDPDRPLIGSQGKAVFNPDSSSFKILNRLLQDSARQASEWGMRFVVLILPDGYSIERLSRGSAGVMDPLRVTCQQSGLEVIDLAEPLLLGASTEGLESLFIDRFHYTARGNELVGQYLAREIAERSWTR